MTEAFEDRAKRLIDAFLSEDVPLVEADGSTVRMGVAGNMTEFSQQELFMVRTRLNQEMRGSPDIDYSDWIAALDKATKLAR